MLRRKRLDLWLPSYLMSAPSRAIGRLRRRGRLTHVLFLVCDHFEPRHGARDENQPFERLRTWHRGYADFQNRCRAEFGTAPLHTWFYPPHHGAEHLSSLSDMVYDGLGEVELHYHHDGDTAATLKRDLEATLAEYRRWGLLLDSGDSPKTSFGFIHGDWALNNSCGGRFCGVNDETDILASLGCWGDMTMPSANQCQTRKINAIYYAHGDTRRPKSHDTGRDARVGDIDPTGFFMLQGPLAINWRAPGYPRIENASLTSDNWGRPDRIRRWLDCQVHVKGRPEWLFVKLHAHGAIERDFNALFGEKAMAMHRVLNREYNDGKRYRLHYVTARQAYNIAKAAEHGKTGDPAVWRDFIVPPQPHAFYTIDAAHDLAACTAERLVLRNIDSRDATRLRTRVCGVEALSGPLREVDIDAGRLRLRTTSGASLLLRLASGTEVGSVEGGSASRAPLADGASAWRISAGPATTITLVDAVARSAAA